MRTTLLPLLLCLLIFVSCKENNPTKTDELLLEEELIVEQEEPLSPNHRLLLGKWQSLDDSKSHVLFDGYLKIDTYQGSSQISGRGFVIADRCLDLSNTHTAKEADRYINIEQLEECLYIVRLDQTHLELSVVGRGNMLKYQRIE